MKKKLKLGLFGFGCVGQGLYHVLHETHGVKAEIKKIEAYGSLVTIARAMGHSEAADLLQETLDEEKETDALLTQIAEGHINEEALAEGSEEEAED